MPNLSIPGALLWLTTSFVQRKLANGTLLVVTLVSAGLTILWCIWVLTLGAIIGVGEHVFTLLAPGLWLLLLWCPRLRSAVTGSVR